MRNSSKILLGSFSLFIVIMLIISIVLWIGFLTHGRTVKFMYGPFNHIPVSEGIISCTAIIFICIYSLTKILIHINVREEVK